MLCMFSEVGNVITGFKSYNNRNTEYVVTELCEK